MRSASGSVDPPSAVEPTTSQKTAEGDLGWRSLYKLAAIGALSQLALIPVAMAFFIASPPPATTAELFALYQRSTFLGLIALDLVYLVARIGLVRLVTGDRRPPLILDDPFVTFDDDRATRAL